MVAITAGSESAETGFEIRNPCNVSAGYSIKAASCSGSSMPSAVTAKPRPRHNPTMARNCQRARARVNARDEAAVQLQARERQALERSDGGIAGAEIVERNRRSELTQSTQAFNGDRACL